METLLLYFGKMTVCSAVLFAYYLLFLKDKTFHHYNRFYLLIAVLVSLLLPLLKVSYFTIEVNKELFLLLNNINPQPQNLQDHVYSYYTFFYICIGLVTFFFLGKLIISLVKINQLKNTFPHEEVHGVKFYQTNLEEAPFSFFKNLFWKKSIQLNSTVGKQILKHEMIHIEQKHTWDKLFMQLVKSVFWFNPLFHIINKEINLIHEYLADNKAVQRSDTKAFAQMLLESHFPGRSIPATSPFLSSNIKKRLKMLQQPNTKYSYARRIFALPILFSLSFAYMVNAKNKEIEITNKVIDLAVDNLDRDTISPNRTEMETAKNQLKVSSDNLAKENKKISEISSELAVKSKEIKDLVKSKKTDSPEFEAKQKEMERLSNKIDEIANGPEFQKNIKELEGLATKIDAYYNSPEMLAKQAKLQKRAQEMEARFNSPEHKSKIAKLEKTAKEMADKFNSAEYKSKMSNLEKMAKEMADKFNSAEYKSKMSNLEKMAKEMEVKFNTPEYKAKMADFEKKAKVMAAQFNTPEFKAKFDRLNYSFNNINTSNLKELKALDGANFYFGNANDIGYGRELTPKEKRQLQKQKKEVEKLQKKLNEKRKELIIDKPWATNQTPNLKTQVKSIFSKSYGDIDKSEIVYYVDGKKVGKNYFENIDPKKIESITVNKSVKNGVQNGELFIKTKQ